MPKVPWNINHMKGSCSQKVSYADRSQAEAFGLRRKQRAYRCGACQGWHLTAKFLGRHRPCNARIRYAEESRAQELAQDSDQRAYLCSTCKGWHLTGRNIVADPT